MSSCSPEGALSPRRSAAHKGPAVAAAGDAFLGEPFCIVEAAVCAEVPENLLAADVARAREEVAGLEKQIGKLRCELEEVETRKAERTAVVTYLDEAVEKRTKTIDSLVEQTNKKNAEVALLASELRDLEKQKAKKTTKVNSLDKAVQKRTKEVESLVQQTNKRKVEVASLASELQDLEKQKAKKTAEVKASVAIGKKRVLYESSEVVAVKIKMAMRSLREMLSKARFSTTFNVDCGEARHMICELERACSLLQDCLAKPNPTLNAS